MRTTSVLLALMLVACGGAAHTEPAHAEQTQTVSPAPTAPGPQDDPWIAVSRDDLVDEASTNVQSIATGVQAWFYNEHWSAGGGGVTTSVLPTSAPRTPASPSPDPQPWPADDADPTWQDVGFMPEDPQRCAYEYTVAPDALSFVVSADCGLFVLEMRGHVDPDPGDITMEAPTYR